MTVSNFLQKRKPLQHISLPKWPKMKIFWNDLLLFTNLRLQVNLHTGNIVPWKSTKWRNYFTKICCEWMGKYEKCIIHLQTTSAMHIVDRIPFHFEALNALHKCETLRIYMLFFRDYTSDDSHVNLIFGNMLVFQRCDILFLSLLSFRV